MADASKVTSLENNAIYYEVSPTIICLLRLFNVLVVLMSIISLVLCIVKANEDNHAYYLLACNTLISGVVGVVVNWWYRGGDLSSDKFWYLFLVGAVIIFQCIITDVFVFHKPPPTPIPPTTRRPTSFRPTIPRNITSITIGVQDMALDVLHVLTTPSSLQP